MDKRFSRQAVIELLESRIANIQSEARLHIGREFDSENGYSQVAGSGEVINRLYGVFAAYSELLEDLTGV